MIALFKPLPCSRTCQAKNATPATSKALISKESFQWLVEKLLRCSDASGSFFLQAQLCLIPKWTHRFCWCLASTNTIWIEKKWESEVGPSSLLVVSYDPAGLSWFWSWLFYGNHLPEFSFFRSIICIRAGVQQPMLFPIRTLPNSSSANGGHILCN